MLPYPHTLTRPAGLGYPGPGLAKTGAYLPVNGTGAPGFAAYHVLALIAPYLRGADRALIDRLGADYMR